MGFMILHEFTRILVEMATEGCLTEGEQWERRGKRTEEEILGWSRPAQSKKEKGNDQC